MYSPRQTVCGKWACSTRRRPRSTGRSDSRFCARLVRNPTRHLRGSKVSGSPVPPVTAPPRGGLPGIPRIPKKKRGAQSRVGSGRHRAPRCLSAPSARDRDLFGVTFASSRLPPGGSGRRPHERFVRQEPYGRRLSRARAAGIRRLARQRSGRGVRRGGVPGRPHERCRRRPSGWPQETCWITPSTRPREPPWHSGRIR